MTETLRIFVHSDGPDSQQVDAAPGIEPPKPPKPPAPFEAVAWPAEIWILQALKREPDGGYTSHFYWSSNEDALEKILERPEYDENISCTFRLLPPGLSAEHGRPYKVWDATGEVEAA